MVISIDFFFHFFLTLLINVYCLLHLFYIFLCKIQPMKKIKTLTVLFDKVLKPNEIPKFRGAVLGKIDQPDLLFHNHFDKEQFVYEYP